MLELLEEQVNELLDAAFPEGMPVSRVEAAVWAGRCVLIDGVGDDVNP